MWTNDEPIRVCEWSRVSVAHLSRDQRDALSDLARRWRQDRNLPVDPISFEGPAGETLVTRQYVGVLAHDGVVVEVYPKLDQHLLTASRVTEPEATTVLRNLLWMIHVAGMFKLVETGVTSLLTEPSSYVDLFAQLLAVNLRRQLEYGHHRQYVECSADLAILRGRLDVGRQISAYAGRLDRFTCDFDEFTVDTPMNQLFLCACRSLGQVVRDTTTRNALNDCAYLLDEVGDIDAVTAVRQTEWLVFSRTAERFRPTFELARDLLAGTAPNLGLGNRDTFVFLIDMNKLFEEFVGAVIEERFRTTVANQVYLGSLLDVRPGGMRQLADYLWKSGGRVWIGDAKYKHLAAGRHRALTFSEIAGEEDSNSALAGHLLSTDDIRQLTVYGELYRRQNPVNALKLALLYPFVGTGRFDVDTARTWSGTDLTLVPVRLSRGTSIDEVLPMEFAAKTADAR